MQRPGLPQPSAAFLRHVPQRQGAAAVQDAIARKHDVGPAESPRPLKSGDDHLVFYKDFICSPCITNYNEKVSRCTNPRCMLDIGVDEVIKGIDRRFGDRLEAARKG